MLGKVELEPTKEITRLPELVLYDHIGFKGSYARTNLSFHYVGDYWNDRMSCVIVVSGVWRFFRDDYYKGPHWDLGPGYYESFFAEKGPDDVVSSFQCIELTSSSPRVSRGGEAVLGFVNFLFAGLSPKTRPVSCRNCVGKDCFGATPKPHAGRAHSRRNCDLEHFARAAQERVNPAPPWP